VSVVLRENPKAPFYFKEPTPGKADFLGIEARVSLVEGF
jgi:hypothetical protein